MKHALCLAMLFLAVVQAAASAQDDVADVPCQDLRVAGNQQQRYFLIGAKPDAKAPDQGYALLVVLPGGDGSADFNPFVKRIWQNVLPEGYLVAELVAAPIEDQNQIVWPTNRDKDRKQSFSTEDFIKAVIADVKAKQKINDAKSFAFGWSSGGPAVYAASLMKETPLKGAFVAMSVFYPTRLPPLEGAQGMRYSLLQSPQDRVTQYHFAMNAKVQLSKAGAAVELRDYEGGHGWRGNIYGNIRAGIDWLEKTP